MKHALAAMAGLAVGLPAMAAVASMNDDPPTGALPARYLPWVRAGHRLPTAFAGPHQDRTHASPTRASGRAPAPLAGRSAGRTFARRPVRTPLPDRRRSLARTPAAGVRVPPFGGRPPSRVPAPSPGGPLLSSDGAASPLGGAPTHDALVPSLTGRPGDGGSPSARPARTPQGRHGTAADAGGERRAGLSLSMSAPPEVRPGGRYSYTVRLINQGPRTPGAVTIRSTLPEGVGRTGARLPEGVGGYAAGREAALVVPRPAPGRPVTMRLDVRLRPGTRGTLVARSRIAYADGVWAGDGARAVTRVR